MNLRTLFCLLFLLVLPTTSMGQEVDWKETVGEAVDTLQQYLRFDTTNPPGDVTEAADFLQKALEKEGLTVTRYEAAPGKINIAARIKGTGKAKPILLLHHMDVVPADASRWNGMDPFGGQLKDGHIWGRGAIDMKGTGVLQLYAFLTLARQKIALDRDIIFMAVNDEEIGGTMGTRYMIDHHYDEFDPEYVLDEGGFGSREIFVKGKLVFGVSVAEKRALWLRVTAHGIAGHGSQPHDHNPNDKLMRALTRLFSKPFPTVPNAVLDALETRIGPLTPNQFTSAIRQTTVSLTSLRSGVGDPPKANVIPSLAVATLDARLLPGMDAEAFLAEVQSRLGEEVDVEVIHPASQSVVTAHDTGMFRALSNTIIRHHPDATVVPMIIPYGTDSRMFRLRGAKCYGILPLVLTTALATSIHGDAERIPVDQFETGIRIYYETLLEVAAR
ncbi:M20/M25/M40 family metallo-hydrolase [Candidatus Nitrospira allomarina]|uniref:M20/M25/M40 family metallo-hydrolase n=1 Tax=Candidatus Nitrospira allomarina TaxID=3020900 RepID=A0AA96JSA2_9BACT|nr:M20/M25/M40 family metallo-hydrolase [Candidatus Nitrospira allomarina]WNM58033.1 M20/M25/M40 family metallo-hydrolase [Candidatus Nitrospira allomarina]